MRFDHDSVDAELLLEHVLSHTTDGAEQLGLRLTKRKLAQTIPIAGGVVDAVLSRNSTVGLPTWITQLGLTDSCRSGTRSGNVATSPFGPGALMPAFVVLHGQPRVHSRGLAVVVPQHPTESFATDDPSVCPTGGLIWLDDTVSDALVGTLGMIRVVDTLPTKTRLDGSGINGTRFAGTTYASEVSASFVGASCSSASSMMATSENASRSRPGCSTPRVARGCG